MKYKLISLFCAIYSVCVMAVLQHYASTPSAFIHFIFTLHYIFLAFSMIGIIIGFDIPWQTKNKTSDK